MTSLLGVRGLQTRFFTMEGVVKAVDGVSLDVARAEIVGLVGESGCGKSMTALSIMRLVRPPGRIVGGQIVFNDRDLLELSEVEMRNIRGKDISMVFQDPMTYLNPVMRIGDQIGEVIKLHQHLSRSECREMAIQLLENTRMVASSEVVDYYPHQLSGGMKQRVLIAMAISCSPALVLADEPTTALDVTIQAQILALIKSLTKKLGISLLLATHDLGMVADVCDRVYVMYAGRIVESADVFSIYEHPLHPYTQGLLSTIPTLERRRQELKSIEGTVPDALNLPAGCRFHPRCSFRMSICEKVEPELTDHDHGHYVSCFLYNGVQKQ